MQKDATDLQIQYEEKLKLIEKKNMRFVKNIVNDKKEL